MESPFLSNPPESSSQPEGEQTKIKKGKKVMSLKDAEEESTESDSDDDETIHMLGFMVESSKKKELNKFDFVTENEEHVHLTEKQINQQKKIEEEAKSETARREGEIKKEEEDDTSEVITEFKASDLHLGKLREVAIACPNKKGKEWTSIYKQIQERMDYLCTTKVELGIDLDRLNDLANKKRKGELVTAVRWFRVAAEPRWLWWCASDVEQSVMASAVEMVVRCGGDGECDSGVEVEMKMSWRWCRLW
nr:hypothetical protein [Tanacetum cinerariifolium]